MPNEITITAEDGTELDFEVSDTGELSVAAEGTGVKTTIVFDAEQVDALRTFLAE